LALEHQMPPNQVLSRTYFELLRQARRSTRRADEAEDLLQAVLLSAIEHGRTDFSVPANRRWLAGAIRRRAAFEARSALRRRRRETHWQHQDHEPDPRPDALPLEFVASLPPSLKTTALLVLTGHNRKEIMWLQRLSDAALRQRLSQIGRRWREAGGNSLQNASGLSGNLNFGLLRRALIGALRGSDAALASHDPDGHLFVIGSLTKHVTSATGKRRLNHQE
jgi:RNA polymerase sigma-70 factor (ECF subfamily)